MIVEELNPQQTKAVTTIDGPLLVLAGAGTGKTKVLTTRIARIICEQKAYPSQILAMTFTNKAAHEMKERVSTIIGDQVYSIPWLGTFHFIGAKFLRRHAELAGLSSNFTILDSDDILRLIKQLLQEKNIDDKRWNPRAFANLIDQCKNEGLNPEDTLNTEMQMFADHKGSELYACYQQRLQKLNACDFGGLLLNPINIFRKNDDILKEYHHKFRYIMVDEYQDTNVAQYMLLRLLTQKTGENSRQKVNICCVGDDDQSIYAWRGAKVENILRFAKDFPDATVINLEQNYRSTSPILKTAIHLISHNENRLHKTLFTKQKIDEEQKVQVHVARDSTEEVQAIINEIECLRYKEHPLSRMAILVRASFQMREFEEHFLKHQIRYNIIGSQRFYDRLEIRDSIAYFRLVYQANDNLAFERIVNTPKRGIGNTTLSQLRHYAQLHNLSMLNAAKDMIETEELPKQRKAPLANLLENINRWSELLTEMPHTKVAEIILEESGYMAMWQNDKSPEAQSRQDNLKELLRAMESFDSIGEFLENVSLVANLGQNRENTDAVQMMTLHSAKGLEFDTVFLPGWEEGLFPHQRSIDEEGLFGLEEERRLAYVGITRARKQCHIWLAARRRIHSGFWQPTLPSQFLKELPSDEIEFLDGDINYQYTAHYSKNTWIDSYKESSDPLFKEDNTPLSHKKYAFTIGDKVFHIKFGYGNIIAIEDQNLTIDFDHSGQKCILDSFIKPIK
ncbi:ATP-dependent DNA helicase UvrD/PcrA [Liberibacter crescens BT-1]|uniref:DNA 3'-5' helicase n=1 Tax=Liberibacter crescens (strain BT-1) TaxID=1215343 RepID=L0ESZ5_LIBCB|nr:UvrD-helicase domain-containing protein [Liberibacter crescens]AGA64649.1 ATP-dependent DNA helicase UvrD/PcrA [Liberibacter crescens BT-1]